MLAGALGGAGMLAGCGGDGDGDSAGTTTTTTEDLPGLDDTTTTAGDTTTTTGGDTATTETTTTEDVMDDVVVEGQTLRVPTDQNPETVHFADDYAIGAETELDSAETIYPATHAAGLWGRWYSNAYAPAPGESHPELITNFEIERWKITMDIHPDAGWSDGVPVTAYDAASMPVFWRGSGVNPPEDKSVEETSLVESVEARSFRGSVGRYEFPDGQDGKRIVYHAWEDEEWRAQNEQGFHTVRPRRLLWWFCGPNRRDGPRLPPHVEPWKTMLEDRWEAWNNHNWGTDDPQASRFKNDYVAEYVTQEMLENTRRSVSEGGNMPSCGAWKVEEVRGSQEVVLTPNEHFYAADQVNFDEVIFEFSQEDRRTRASLQSGRLDYAQVSVPPETQSALPEKYENVNSPSGAGYALDLDHSSIFGDVRVRQAIMYALDKESIAQNIHPNTAEPITIPGWTCGRPTRWSPRSGPPRISSTTARTSTEQPH